MNPNTIMDDDSEPENISFTNSKKETKENVRKVRDQLKTFKDEQKQKRKEQQEKNIKQKIAKVKKQKKFTVPEEVLQEIGLINKKEMKKSSKESSKTLKDCLNKKDRTIKVDNNDKAVSDLVSIKSYRKYNVSISNLSTTDKKVLIASEAAKNFKLTMFNRRGINRQTAQERISILTKRKVRFNK